MPTALGNFLVPQLYLEAYSNQRQVFSVHCSSPIMKPPHIHRYTHREMMEDAFIVLMPAILTVGILFFFWNDLIPVP